jgi:site-specific DNA-cytosine methylase
MQWVSPELDMRGIGFNSKAFQVPASQTRLYLMGTRHEFCPLGLMHDVSRAIKMEVKADGIAGKLNRADAEALDTQSMHIKRQGLNESKLSNPMNNKNLGMTKYSQSLKATMAIELANNRITHFTVTISNEPTLVVPLRCAAETTPT